MSIVEPNTTEAYAFACLKCGYGWEQSYEIEHRADTFGQPYVTYLVDGVRVPSPLTRPTCQNCDGHLIRIMRAGVVAEVTSRGTHRTDPTDPTAPTEPTRQPGQAAQTDQPPAPQHRSPRGFLHRRQGPAGTA
jgi:hypothetical protein